MYMHARAHTHTHTHTHERTHSSCVNGIRVRIIHIDICIKASMCTLLSCMSLYYRGYVYMVCLSAVCSIIDENQKKYLHKIKNMDIYTAFFFDIHFDSVRD
jgi:hypothetical protein